MVTLIFGAGASFGSGNCYPTNPPLGNDLFNELVKLDGAFSRLDKKMKNEFKKKGFEEGMALIQNDSSIINPIQKEVASYLSQFKVENDNAYVNLFKSIKEVINDITIVTLNYDLLIEDALRKNLLFIKYELDWKHGVSLLKPHGSCGFLPDLGGMNMSGNTMINCGTFVDGLKIFRSINKEEIINWCEDPKNSDISPVLSMYNKEKRIVINKNFISNIQEIYKKKIENSRMIILIGVKYIEHDTHIWEPIKNSKAKVYFNSRSGISEEMEKWSKENDINLFSIKGSFNEKIEEISNLILNKLLFQNCSK